MNAVKLLIILLAITLILIILNPYVSEFLQSLEKRKPLVQVFSYTYEKIPEPDNINCNITTNGIVKNYGGPAKNVTLIVDVLDKQGLLIEKKETVLGDMEKNSVEFFNITIEKISCEKFENVSITII